MHIFDTHTHDYFDDFKNDRKAMIQGDFDSGVIGKIEIGCDEKTSLQAIELSHTDEKIWATVGVHPCMVEENFENITGIFATFEKLILENPQKIVGIGETGFDFYHKDSVEMREKQKQSFLKHIELAEKYKKPLIIHTRNARNETLEFFKETIPAHANISAVIHCFSENSEFAKMVTEEYGFFLGIGGVATFPACSEIRKAIANTPLEFLVTETDSPYLAPQSVRGKRNQSKNIAEVIELIADLKQIDIEKCAKILEENARRLFHLS